MIYQNNNLVSSEELIKGEQYFDTSKEFFSNLGKSMHNALFQVLKIETRQVYQEPGNLSFELFVEQGGDIITSVKLLSQIKEDDIEFYKAISGKGVDFIRCRPILFPLSLYLEWELENYFINSLYAERIFLCDRKDKIIKHLYDNLIQHDFMIIDTEIAYVHNYDANGLIQGGWKLTDSIKINQLMLLFILSKSRCIRWDSFLKQHSIELASPKVINGRGL